MPPAYNRMKLESNNRRKFTNTYKLNIFLLNSQWVKQEIPREIRKYFDMIGNENITYQNLWERIRAVQGKFITVNTYINREKDRSMSLLSATGNQVTAPGLVLTKPVSGLHFLLPWVKAYPSGFLFTCLSAELGKQCSSFSGFEDSTEGAMLVIPLSILYLKLWLIERPSVTTCSKRNAK